MKIDEKDDYNILILDLIDKQNKLDYIAKYKNKELRQKFGLQKHHIYPKHTYKIYKDHTPLTDINDPSNLVICTLEDHCQAHKIRFGMYKDFYDQSAYYFLRNNTVEGNKACNKAIADKHRQNKTGFFNLEFQKEMALRPKSLYFLRENPDLAKKYSVLAKGISKNTSEKTSQNYKERGEFVGKNFGSKGGLKHQDPKTRSRLAGHLRWKHVNVETGDIKYADMENMKSLVQVKEKLNQVVSGAVKFTSGLSEVIREIEKQRYGWSLE